MSNNLSTRSLVRLVDLVVVNLISFQLLACDVNCVLDCLSRCFQELLFFKLQLLLELLPLHIRDARRD